MPRGKVLTSEEIATIALLKKEGYSNRQIAEKIGRSPRVINNYFKDPENYGKNQKGRTAKATTERDRRVILREASNFMGTARQIKAKSGVKASVRTVQRIIKSSPHIRRQKLKRKPVLKSEHRAARLNFGRAHMAWTDEWKKVIFSDEKKFNLDGPDGFRYYFHDLRKNQVILSRRPSAYGSVKVWGAISSKGPIDLVFLKGKQSAKSYVNRLETQLPKIQSIMGGKNWIFQQDNAGLHTAKIVMSWFQQRNVQLLEWPALSPDLNIIENIWSWLSRMVYADGKQYHSQNDLRNAVQNAWNTIPSDLINKLYTSMPQRIFSVITEKGGHTKY